MKDRNWRTNAEACGFLSRSHLNAGARPLAVCLEAVWRFVCLMGEADHAQSLLQQGRQVFFAGESPKLKDLFSSRPEPPSVRLLVQDSDGLKAAARQHKTSPRSENQLHFCSFVPPLRDETLCSLTVAIMWSTCESRLLLHDLSRCTRRIPFWFDSLNPPEDTDDGSFLQTGTDSVQSEGQMENVSVFLLPENLLPRLLVNTFLLPESSGLGRCSCKNLWKQLKELERLSSGRLVRNQHVGGEKFEQEVQTGWRSQFASNQLLHSQGWNPSTFTQLLHLRTVSMYLYFTVFLRGKFCRCWWRFYKLNVISLENVKLLLIKALQEAPSCPTTTWKYLRLHYCHHISMSICECIDRNDPLTGRSAERILLLYLNTLCCQFFWTFTEKRF